MAHPPGRDRRWALNPISEIRDQAIPQVLFFTGCRVSEVTHSKACDFIEDVDGWLLDCVVQGDQRHGL